MESAYLKSHVGPVLAKAVAETVAAQPANPQEYLALYLLHHIQEEERKQGQRSRLSKVSQLEQTWAAEQTLREQRARDTIARGVGSFRAKIAARKAAEAALAERYEEATGDAEDLLEQEEAMREEQKQQGNAANEYEANTTAENKALMEKLQEEEESFLEKRAEFYKTQRFMLSLQKSHLGELKNTLTEFKDRVRMGIAAVETIRDNTMANEIDAAEKDWRESARQDAQQFSETAAALAAQALGHRSHDRIAVHHALYRVLRCLCYLVLDATPKSTDSAVKVAALVKPTVLAATLRAFNPVAGYDRAVPLKLERKLPANSDEKEQEDGGNGGFGAEDGADSYPMPQPRPRQVRRAQRVLRALYADAEYLCLINPADFFDEDVIQEDADAADAEAEEAQAGTTAGKRRRTIKDEVSEVEAAQEKAAQLKERVEAQVKQRGGLVLWALLRFVKAAVDFRQSRDSVLRMRRELGLEVSAEGSGSIAALLEEVPEEEEEDERNDEALFDEEGEPDATEIARLQARIGTDGDEQLVKLWEAKDARRTRELESRAQAFRAAGEGGEEEEEDEDGADEGDA